MAKAKRPSMTDLFTKTETAPGEKKTGKRRPLGLYLRNDVIAEVESIADENGQAVHGIITYAVSYFIKQYRAGKVKIETETKQKLKLDL